MPEQNVDKYYVYRASNPINSNFVTYNLNRFGNLNVTSDQISSVQYNV